MGLASALSTALTGMTAAETTIDVVGNNLANSNTVGFKASKASFATQFLQTLSLGAQPNGNSGGTNPRQIGLGTMVAEVTPNFAQGTVEISSTPTDLAIQGDGFYIVQAAGGEQLYTRNGQFKLNSENELVTTTGQRLLGYGINDQFEIQRTELTPLTIPLGSAVVAQPTQNVFLEGTLSPTGDVANVAEQIETDILGTGLYARPEEAAAGVTAPTMTTTGVSNAVTAGTLLTDGTYQYKFVYADGPYSPSYPLTESLPSATYSVNVVGGADSIQLNFPAPDPLVANDYGYIRAYRCEQGGSDYHYVGETTWGAGSSITDATAEANLTAAQTLNTDVVTTESNIQYRYYVTFADSTGGYGVGTESRPSPISEPITVTNGRIQLTDLPVPTPPNDNNYTVRRIYRCASTSTNDTDFYYVGEVPNVDSGATFTDNVPDSKLVNAALPNNGKINMDGPPINTSTRLVDLLRRQDNSYEHVFEQGTLQFTGSKGGRSTETQNLNITDTTTVSDLLAFMEQSLGIQKAPGSDPAHPIPKSQDPPPNGAEPGGTVIGSRIVLTGNNGEDNAISIGLSGMLLKTAAGTSNVNLPFGSTQSAVGESAVCDFLVYDSLGIPLQVRMTAVMESRNSTSTTYRWFADSANNDPSVGVGVAVGTGLITFDGQGNFVSATNSTISIDRAHVSSQSPLQFECDFSKISGLAADSSSLAVSRQDGSPPGTLTSYIVGEDGIIRGVFSNGVTRDLGLIRLARFANSAGLEQQGENLYAKGVNSGLPIEADPGNQGLGKIVAGATELSNTDIGGNLIDLILASTMYRGNTRVITTVQQMVEELLALRR